MDSAEPNSPQPISRLADRGELITIAAGVGAIAVGLIIRTDIVALIMAFILEILGWAAVAAGIGAIGAAIYSYGAKRHWWDPVIAFIRQKNLTPMLRGIFSSGAFFLVLLSLLLPWMSISAFGESESALGISMLGVTGSSGASDFGDAGALGAIAVIALYLALLLAIAGVALFFLREDQRGKHIRAAVGAAGLLALIIFPLATMLAISSAARISIGDLARLSDALGISLNWSVGYWLSLIAFIAAIALQFVPLPFADAPKEDDADESTDTVETT